MGSVPSSVAPSTANTVPINMSPQRGKMNTTLGSKEIPYVPKTDVGTSPPQPPGPHGLTQSTHLDTGNGAPSVPAMNGVLFRAGPIDTHYQSEIEAHNPYSKVNNPPTHGMVSWIKGYLNHAFRNQYTDSTGWEQRVPQQRTSYMRVTDISHAIGYDAGEQWLPHQLPQAPYTQRFLPTVGTDAPNVSVLNSSTYGAGQTAGGVGGSNYTPTPGPPNTNNVNGTGTSAMPTWG